MTKKHKDELKQEQKEETQEETVQETKQTIDPRDAKIAELTDTLKRLQAEFENYRKRTEKSNCDFRKYANEELINKILQPIDYFEMSLKHSEDKESFIKGVEMIYAQLISVLETEGLKYIDVLNKPFNPETSEAIAVIENKDAKPNIVVEEVQKGYFIGDKILRHAKVKITK